MAHPGLLQDCRDYFQRAQSSWDAYFSKWETMAEEEFIEEEGDLFSSEETVPVRKHGKDLIARQLRKKSIAFLNGKKLMSNVERKSKWKSDRVHSGKSRDRKRETEIIHTTENQTNLECEVVNNKHFEADLKAIFIEILSENTNKMGMFSVLSRTFSGSGETISNFSLSSMIMEKNGFSISPVSKTVLHSVSRNEFPLGGIPRGGLRDASARSCVNVTQSHASNGLRTDDSNVRECRITPRRNQRITTTKDSSDVTHRWEREKYIPMSMDSLRRLSTSMELTNSTGGCSSETISDSPRYGSPEATLSKILRTPGSITKKCVRKKKRANSFLESSDDDDSEEDAKTTPGRFLKIFCTPKRPRRSVKREVETVSDDDDCFRIFDRVKTDKN